MALEHSHLPVQRLHHVGFVVAQIDSVVRNMASGVAAVWDEVIYTDPLQRVRVTFLRVDRFGNQIELVEPLGADSPVFRFLRQQSGGLHHVCFETSDIDASLGSVRAAKGIIVSRAKPAVAFGGRSIAWALTQERLLVEFLQQADLTSTTSVGD
jgi:methylmalonyl-CoA/ethylmalonyl-CoA epimerase